MSIYYNKNGLELKEITSSVKEVNCKENFNDVKDLYKFIKDNSKFVSAFVVFYTYTKVLFGEYNENGIAIAGLAEFVPSEIIKFRIFNPDAELYMWRVNGGFKGRLRTDGEGNTVWVVDAGQITAGTKSVNIKDKCTELSEERGIRFVIPSKILNRIEINEDYNRLIVKSRNYIGFSSGLIASYNDCRLMGFSCINKLNKEVA